MRRRKRIVYRQLRPAKDRAGRAVLSLPGMVLRRAVIAALAVLLTGATALAQQGTIAGAVRDQTGAPASAGLMFNE